MSVRTATERVGGAQAGTRESLASETKGLTTEAVWQGRSGSCKLFENKHLWVNRRRGFFSGVLSDLSRVAVRH